MAGRLDTRRRTPPVRIWRAQARVQQGQLLIDNVNVARGAGGYGQREARFGDVPVRLRFQKSAGTNRPAAVGATLPLGQTRRKRGFPPITGTGG